MPNSWTPVDFSDVKSKFFLLLKKKIKRIEDYVAIRNGFTHVCFSCYKHRADMIAAIAMVQEIDEDEFNYVSLRPYDKAGVPIKYQLECSFCDD